MSGPSSKKPAIRPDHDRPIVGEVVAKQSLPDDVEYEYGDPTDNDDLSKYQRQEQLGAMGVPRLRGRQVQWLVAELVLHRAVTRAVASVIHETNSDRAGEGIRLRLRLVRQR